MSNKLEDSHGYDVPSYCHKVLDIGVALDSGYTCIKPEDGDQHYHHPTSSRVVLPFICEYWLFESYPHIPTLHL